jgi:hypothetical protein
MRIEPHANAEPGDHAQREIRPFSKLREGTLSSLLIGEMRAAASDREGAFLRR